eukprot:7668816-Karenia_brevis.AAC.1
MDFHQVNARTAFLDVTAEGMSLRLVSAHAPHAAYPESEYDAFLHGVEDLVLDARKMKKSVMVGIDANAVLGQSEDTDDPSTIGRHGVGMRNDRGHLFAIWLHNMRLAA